MVIINNDIVFIFRLNCLFIVSIIKNIVALKTDGVKFVIKRYKIKKDMVRMYDAALENILLNI